MKKKKFNIACLIICLVITTQGFALAEGDASVLEDTYGRRTARKLMRGLSNTGLGWVELPQGIHDTGQQHGVGAAATWGVLHGIGRAVQRTAIGIYEVLTFPFGVPDDFGPIMEPEFVLGQPER